MSIDRRYPLLKQPAHFDITSAEKAAQVTVVDDSYPVGYVYRYGTNTAPGTTDMTSAINGCAKICRQGNYTMQLPPETSAFSSPLDFSGIRVVGTVGYPLVSLKASSSQFDCITSTGHSAFENFFVDGGWNGVTAGLSGDTFSLVGAPFCYGISFNNVYAWNNKKRGLFWQGAGYSRAWGFDSFNSGLHGGEILGASLAQISTTVTIGGNSRFSSCPNGYGFKLTEAVSVTLDGVIMENNAHGIQINGNDNRALTFKNVYQEVIADNVFLDATGSAGIGLLVEGCYDPVATIVGTSGWGGVCYGAGNVLSGVPFQLPQVTLAGGLLLATPTSATQSSAHYAGSGTPSNANGNNGDYYFRSDTPGIANQRVYIKSAGAWIGII